MVRRRLISPRPTADYIALHARQRPGQVAIVSDGGETTYATLHRELAAITAAVSRLGVTTGAVIAVAHPDIHAQLLILLACERLGLVMAPFRTDEGATADPVFTAADLVISPIPISSDRCRRCLHITDEWLAAALSEAAGEPPRWPKPSRDDPVLLLRSSGSTGRPKPILITHAMLSARLAGRVAAMDFRRSSRFLAVMQFTVGTALYNSLLCLRMGATVIARPQTTLAETLTRWRPTQLYILPFQLARLLSGGHLLPRLPELTLIVGGAKLSSDLRREALERLCGRVICSYGTNETSTICRFDEDDRGWPVRGASIAILDEHGGHLAPGGIGEICVRGPSVIAGYHGAAPSSEAAARDGWWRTGDFGRLDAQGRLTLVGRREDLLDYGATGSPDPSEGVMNFGGLKRATADVEAEIQALADCDIAVLAARDARGATCAAVCAVTGVAEAARLAASIRRSVTGRFVVYSVNAIPRTPEGKLRRAALGEALAGRAPVQPAEVG